MPIDSILVSAAVVTVFVIFASVLIWADFQSEPTRRESDIQKPKHRSF
jgi:hypothetical protein